MSDIQIIIQDQEDISLEVQSDSEGVTEVSVSAPVSVEVVQNAVFNFSTGDGETAPGATVLDELNDVQVGSSALQGQILYYDVNAGKYLKGDYDDIAGIPTLATVATTGSYDDLTDTPTINEGEIWVGDANGDPVSTDINTVIPAQLWTEDGDNIYYDTGDVGIGGTPDSGIRLHIKKNSDAYFLVENTASGGEWVRWGAGLSGTSMKFSNTGIFGIQPVASKTDNSIPTAFHMASDGKVGINTNSPSEKLHVAGNIFMSEGSQLRSQTTDPTAGAQAQSLEFFLPYRSDGVTMGENRSGLMLGGVKFFEPRTTNSSTLHVFGGVKLAGTNAGAGGTLSLNLGSSSDQYPATSVSFGWARVGNTGNRKLQLYGYFGTEFSTNASGNTTAHSLINDTGLALGHTNPTAPIDIEAAANIWHIKADEYGYVGWKGGATQYFQGWSGRIVAKFAGTEGVRFRQDGVGIGNTGDPDARLEIKAAGDDNTTTSILVNNSSGVEMFKVVDDGTVHTKDIKIADTKSIGADGGETINFVKYSGSGVVTFQSDASSNFEFGGGMLVENTTGLMFSDTVAGANKLSAGTHETFNFGKSGTGQANYTFTNEVCDVRFENTCDVVFANGGSVVFGSLEVGTNPTCPSFEVNATRLMYRHSNDCDEIQAVIIDQGGVITGGGTADTVALSIGERFEFRRNGGGASSMKVSNGLVMSGFGLDWTTATSTAATGNGAGLHLGGDQTNLVSLVSMNRTAYFGPLNSAGSTLYIGNTYSAPSGGKSGGATDNWHNAIGVNFMNASNFTINYGGTEDDGSGDFTVLSHQASQTDNVNGDKHGLQLSAVPNAGGNTVSPQSRFAATNGSGDLVADTAIRGYVEVGSVVYIEDEGDGGNFLKLPSTITRHVVTAKDTNTNTITVDPVFSGTTGDVSVFVQKNVVTFRDFAGDPIMRVQGNKNVAIGMDDSPERLSITGRVHLDDGSGNIYIGTNLGNAVAAIQNVVIGNDTFNNVTTSVANVVIGYQAGKEITTSGANVLIGSQAGSSLTTGGNNTYIGTNAGATNDTLQYNVAIGQGAQENFVGQQSTAVGYFAGRNAAGTHTVFGYNAGGTIGQGAALFGYSAGAGSTTTVDTVVGQESYRNVTAGGANVAVGHQVMWSAESAKSLSGNISIGNASMYMAYGSQYNVAIGAGALRGYAGDEVTPGQGDTPNQVTTVKNVAIGERSMYRAWDNAGENVFIGYRTAFSEVGGGQETNTYNQNVGIGNEVGYDIESGIGNVMVGYRAGYDLTTGDKNVLIGWKAGSQLTTESNKLYIANSDTTTPLIYGDFVAGRTAAQNGNGYDGQTGNVGIGKVPTDSSTKFEVAVDHMNPDSSFRIKSVHPDGRFQLLGKANTNEQNIAYVWHVGLMGLGETTGGTSAAGSEGAIGLTTDGRVYMTPGKALSFSTQQIGPLNVQIPFQILPAADNSQTLIRSLISASEGGNTAAGFKYQAQYHHFTVGDTAGLGTPEAPGDAVPSDEGLYIASDGDVGIGTTSPSEQLHVVGKIKLDDGQGGGYTLPSQDGAAGYVLKTDGSGAVTWQADNAGTGGGASVIGDLNDVESTLGAAGEILQVDALGTTLEYIDGIDGITYTNATAMPEAVGGFPAGTTFSAQSLRQMFDGLLYPYQVPTLTLTTNLSSTYEYGTTVSSVTFTLTGTDLNNINSTYSLEREISGTFTSLTVGTIAQINAYVDNNGGTPFDLLPNQYLRYRVTATDIQGNTIQDNSDYAYWRVRSFWGNSSSASETSVFNFTGGSDLLDANRQGVRSFSAGSGVYKYIAIPQAPTDLGDPPAAPAGFKLANGTNVPMATSTSTVPFTGASGATTSNGYECKSITETVNGKTVTYNLYRSENQLNGTLTIQVF